MDDLLLLVWTQLGPMNEVGDGLWRVCADSLGVAQARDWFESVRSGCDKVQADLESMDAKLQEVLDSWSAETAETLQWDLVCVMNVLMASLEKTDGLCEELIRISQAVAERDGACIPQLRELMLTLQYQGAHDTLDDQSVWLRVPGDAPERPLPSPRRDWSAIPGHLVAPRPQPEQDRSIPPQSSISPARSPPLADRPDTPARLPRQTAGRLPRLSVAVQRRPSRVPERKPSGTTGRPGQNTVQLPRSSAVLERRPSLAPGRKPSFANRPSPATLSPRPELGAQRAVLGASSTSRIPGLASRIPSSRIPKRG